MVDFVRYYMEFIHKESCGKCIPCREGTDDMLRDTGKYHPQTHSEDSNATLERFRG